MHTVTKSVLATLLLATSVAAQGQILRCVDKDGKTTFANECPAGSKAQTTGIKSTPATRPAPAASGQPSVAERDAAFRKRQMEQQEAEQKAVKQAAEDKQKLQACEQSRAYLRTLQSGNRVSRTDPNTGERTFLEDRQYAGEIASAQQSVDRNCN